MDAVYCGYTASCFFTFLWLRLYRQLLRRYEIPVHFEMKGDDGNDEPDVCQLYRGVWIAASGTRFRRRPGSPLGFGRLMNSGGRFSLELIP